MYFAYAQHKQKGFAPIFLLIGALVFTGIVGGAFYLGRQTTIPSSGSAATQPTPAASSTPNPTDETDNWKVYTAEGLYQISYPSDTYEIVKGNQYGNNPWKVLEPGVVALVPKTSNNNSAVAYSITIGVMENIKALDLNDPKSFRILI